MREVRVITAGMFLFYALLWSGHVLASEPDVRVNEVLPDPKGKDNDVEFIEIKNPQKIDLTGWTVYIQTEDESQKEAEQIVLKEARETKTKFVVLDEKIGYLNNTKVKVYIHNSQDTQVGPVIEYPTSDQEEPKEATSYGFTEQSDGAVALESITKGEPNTQSAQEFQSSDDQERGADSDQQKEDVEDTQDNDQAEQGQDTEKTSSQSSEHQNNSDQAQEKSSSNKNEESQNSDTKTTEDTSQESTSQKEHESPHNPKDQENTDSNSDTSPQNTDQQSADHTRSDSDGNGNQNSESTESSQTGQPYTGSENIRIQSLVPNPKKADASHEKLTLTNYGERTVNLKEWSILRRNGASRETEKTQLPDISIEKNTSEHVSSSQLPSLINQPSQIVMYSVLTPNGTIADNVYYTQAPEGKHYVYQKEKEEMKWVDPQSTSESQSEEDRTSQAAQTAPQDFRTQFRCHIHIKKRHFVA